MPRSRSEQRPKLIVISGPIAAGKSTLAAAYAQALADAGTACAVIDFDLCVRMVRQPKDDQPRSAWRMARRAAAGLVGGYFADGLSCVVIEGDFWNPGAREEFERYLPDGVDIRYVNLLVRYDTALRRVIAEPSRGVSKDPSFLRSNHDSYAKRLPKLPDADARLDVGDLPVPVLVNALRASTLS